MRKLIRRATLPAIGAALLGAAMFTTTARTAQASRYAIAFGVVTDCGTKPATPCPGEAQ